MATQINYYINSTTGDNTTGDGSSGNPWKGLQRAINGAYAAYPDMVSSDVQITIHCAGAAADVTTDYIDVSPFTTNASCFLVIQADVNHGGAWNTGVYRLELVAGLLCGVSYTRVIGLQIKCGVGNSGTTGSKAFINASGASNLWIDRCILTDAYTGNDSVPDGYSGIYTNGDNGTIRNTLIYGFNQGTTGIGIRATFANAWTLQNVTVVDCSEVGFRFGGTASVFKNCLAQDCPDGYDVVATGSSHNASDVASDAPGTSTQTGDVTFVGGGDFRPAANDTVAKGNGTDLSGSFTVDLANNTRSTWDIGALIAEAAGGFKDGTGLNRGLRRGMDRHMGRLTV